MKGLCTILLIALLAVGCANQSNVKSHGTGRYDTVSSGVIHVPGYTVDAKK